MSMSNTETLAFIAEVEGVGEWQSDNEATSRSRYIPWQGFIPPEIRSSWRNYSFPMRAAIVVTAKHSAEIFKNATQ